LDEVAATCWVGGLTVHPAQRVVLPDNDGLGNSPHPTVRHDVVGELARVVPRPVQRAVPAPLNRNQRPVGARDKARTVVRVRVVACRLQASGVIGDGNLRGAVAVITIGVPFPHTGRGKLGPDLTGVTLDGLRDHPVDAALVRYHAV